jgi:tetratricopeptide (TPR) repeat protein
LRKAELGQARAEARAEGERTRRRLAVGLAGAVLTVVMLGGGTLLLVQRHQAEQVSERARRQQAGEMALAQADTLKQQGRWAEALAGLLQARQRLDARDGQVSRDVRRAVAELELVGRLEEVRLRAAANTEGRTFAWARADGEYESEFRKAGLGGPDEPAEAVAARVRVWGVRAALVAALDAWAWTTEDRRRRDWARAVARSADQSSDWGERLRASWDDRAVLEELAREAPVERLSPHLLGTLAEALGDREAVLLLRKAQLHYPGDFWLTFFLAQRLSHQGENAEAAGFYRAALSLRPDTPAVLVNIGFVLVPLKQLEEAIACYRKAIAHDPKFAPAHNNLGIALSGKGRVEEAIACFRQAIALDPKLAGAHDNLGIALLAKGKVEEAITCSRQAIALDPKLAKAHNNLGNALLAKGKVDEAIACCRKAIALDPKYANAHTNLGRILCDVKRDYDGAIACFQKAIALDPKEAKAHRNLGLALKAKGKEEEAIACFRKAIALDPKYALAHNNLGTALQRKGQVDEAIACFKKAIALDPKLAGAHYNLGNALRGKGQEEEAIACFRKAIQINPNFPEAHCNLGQALSDCGDFAAALGALRRGHELGLKREDWPYPSRAWVRQCQELVEREKKLLAVLGGKAKAAAAGELADHAALAARTRRYVAAARLWGQAFAADPKLGNDLKAGHRYNAACAATQAGTGQGKDAGTLDATQRAELRYRALGWLQDELAAHTRQLARSWAVSGKPSYEALLHWQKDADLAAVRDAVVLAKLPEAEQVAWRNLWAQVDALLARVKPGK